jgi:hypothetical protein
MISVVEVLTGQALVLIEQAKAMRAQLDGIDRHLACLLETIRVLQPPTQQPTVVPRAPKSPPVFGRKAPDVAFETDASAPMTRDDVLAAGAAASSDGDPVGTSATRDTPGDS